MLSTPLLMTSVDKLIKRALKIQQALEAVKPLYNEFDSIIMKLKEEGFKSKVVDGFEVSLVDNFDTKNTCFKASGFKRFDLKIKTKV